MTTSRHATAHWSGDLKTGGGTISTPQSGLMADTAYGFNTRFADGNPDAKRGTNPEELIAAAHAACFTMALSNALAEAGHAPDSVDTRAEVDLSMEGGPTISAIRLTTKAKVPGIEAAKFREIADDAKQNCPVSKALSAVPITLEAELL
ncbi:MAG: OsmC family protein [Luteimonas sp.]